MQKTRLLALALIAVAALPGCAKGGLATAPRPATLAARSAAQAAASRVTADEALAMAEAGKLDEAMKALKALLDKEKAAADPVRLVAVAHAYRGCVDAAAQADRAPVASAAAAQAQAVYGMLAARFRAGAPATPVQVLAVTDELVEAVATITPASLMAEAPAGAAASPYLLAALETWEAFAAVSGREARKSAFDAAYARVLASGVALDRTAVECFARMRAGLAAS